MSVSIKLTWTRRFLTKNSFWFLTRRNQKQYPAPFLKKFGFRNRPHGWWQTLDPSKMVLPSEIFRRSMVEDNGNDHNKNPNWSNFIFFHKEAPKRTILCMCYWRATYWRSVLSGLCEGRVCLEMFGVWFCDVKLMMYACVLRCPRYVGGSHVGRSFSIQKVPPIMDVWSWFGG
jgi:hypothetical protein